MGTLSALVLFIGVIWYPQPGVAPDYNVVKTDTLAACHAMKESFEFSVADMNKDAPPTGFVHSFSGCVVLLDPSSKEDA